MWQQQTLQHVSAQRGAPVHAAQRIATSGAQSTSDTHTGWAHTCATSTTAPSKASGPRRPPAVLALLGTAWLAHSACVSLVSSLSRARRSKYRSARASEAKVALEATLS